MSDAARRSGSFDPYQQWLDIPPHEQPPDHYRLLGVPRFESDAAVIQRAAEMRMAHIRSFQTGPRGKYTQPLLNELAAAKLRLLNPSTKQQYDSALEESAQVCASRFSPELLPPAADDEPDGTDLGAAEETTPAGPSPRPVDIRVATRTPSPRTDRSWDPYLLGWWLPLGGAAIALLAGVAWLIASPDRIPSRPPGAGRVRSPPVPPPVPAASPRVLVFQETSGDVHLSYTVSFPMATPESEAESPAPHAASPDSESAGGAARGWRFKVSKLPPQGMFRARVTYEVRTTGAGSHYVVQLDGTPRKRDLHPPPRGGPVVDEFYLPVPKTGEHLLEVHAAAAGAGFQVQSVELMFPQRVEPLP